MVIPGLFIVFLASFIVLGSCFVSVNLVCKFDLIVSVTMH